MGRKKWNMGYGKGGPWAKQSSFGPEFVRAKNWAYVTYGPFTYKQCRRKNMIDGDSSECDAWIEQQGNEFIITIHKDCKEPIEALLHEIAHMLDWRKSGFKEGHDQQHMRGWSDSFGRVYRDFHHWLAAQ